MSFGERLRQRRKELKLKQEDIANHLGVRISTVSQWETATHMPDIDTVQLLAKYLETSADYLLGLTDSPRPIDISRIPGVFPVGKTVKLPVLGVIRAGEPILAEENIIGWEQISEEDVRDGDYFFLRVTGDSMVDEHIPDGSFVLVRKQDYASSGDIVVALMNGEEATVKKYKPLDGKVLLLPANPRYEPLVYDAEDVRIIGVVREVRIKKK